MIGIVTEAAKMLRYGGYHSEPKIADDLIAEFDRVDAEVASLKTDLKQALRQWAMYAEMVERNCMKRFVQPDPATGYRFTSYRIEGEGFWPFTETGYIYHRIDLSDLSEPYLSAVRKSLVEDATPKEEDV